VPGEQVVPAILRKFLQADAAIFHLSTVGFEADRAGGWDFERVFQNFAVASAMRDAVLHRYLDFIPLLLFVFLEFLVTYLKTTAAVGSSW